MPKTKKISALVQRIIALIQEELRTLEPGRPLPPELELAGRYGVSRKSIRAAMAILEGDGVIYRVRGKGTFPAESGKAPSAFTPRALRIGAAGTVSLGDSGFYGTIIKGAFSSIVSQECELILTGNTRQSMFRLLDNGRVDGMLLVCVTDQALLNDLSARAVPLCLIDHYTEEAAIDCVRVDSYGGSRLAVEHLAALGHERIAYLHPEGADINPLRLEGFKTAIQEKKLTINENLIKFVNGHGPAAAVTQLLSLPEQNRPTALIAFSDDMALQALQAAVKFGIAVPDDLSIIGAGGAMQPLSSGGPELTSIQFNTEELGGTAVNCLMQRIAEPSRAPRQIIVEPHLHLGSTTTRCG